MVRWIIATLILLALGWAYARFGHGVALALMLALLVFVAVFGGHGPRRSAPGEAGAEVDSADETPPR